MTAMTPVMVIYGGGTDGFQSAKDVRGGTGTLGVTEVVVMPFTFLFQGIKHLFFGVVHALDFFLFPVYGAAELAPYGRDVEPLDIYTGTWFDSSKEETAPQEAGTDAESGEAQPR